MGVLDTTVRLLGMSDAIHKWHATLTDLSGRKRGKVAGYATAIADCLARAAQAFQLLELEPDDRRAARDARRELGRITGYVEDMAAVLAGHVDGRKLAGLKRRLDALLDPAAMSETVARADAARIARLTEAEGYFRALADRLTT